MNFGILDTSKMLQLVINLQEKLELLIKDANNKRIVEEIAENMFILITNGEKLFKLDNGDWEKIFNSIELISLMKSRDYPGLTNKTIFKYMDIIDSI